MATMTGIQRLDRLIEIFGWEAGAEESMSDDGRIDYLREPLEAEGYCSTISCEFASFLLDHEVDAYDSGYGANLPAAEYAEAGRNPFYGSTHDAASFGYSDRTREPDYDQHSLTVIHWQDDLYLVDWAASQYGYPEFPFIQKRGPDGSWLRAW